MKLIFSLLGVLAMTVSAATAQVKTGIEVLRDNGFEQLKGKRVGLITNPTGIDSKMSRPSTYSTQPKASSSKLSTAPNTVCAVT